MGSENVTKHSCIDVYLIFLLQKVESFMKIQPHRPFFLELQSSGLYQIFGPCLKLKMGFSKIKKQV